MVPTYTHNPCSLRQLLYRCTCCTCCTGTLGTPGTPAVQHTRLGQQLLYAVPAVPLYLLYHGTAGTADRRGSGVGGATRMQNVLLATVTPQHHDQADDVKAHASYEPWKVGPARIRRLAHGAIWRDMAQYGAIRPRYGRDMARYGVIRCNTARSAK